MQKLIIRYEPEPFSKEVNKYLEEGWRVVPNTLTVVNVDIGGDQGGKLLQRFMVAIEKV